MYCNACGYNMGEYWIECPRCAGKGLGSPPPRAEMDGRSLFRIGLLAVLVPLVLAMVVFPRVGMSWGVVPLVGLGLCLVVQKIPLRAGDGAMAGCLLALAFQVVFQPPWGQVREAAERDICRANLGRLAVDARRFARSNDGVLPDISSGYAIEYSLAQYESSLGLFSCPTDHLEYRGNEPVAGEELESIDDPGQTILFYEVDPVHPGPEDRRELGFRNVVYVDGQVGRVRNEDWERVKKLSGIL